LALYARLLAAAGFLATMVAYLFPFLEPSSPGSRPHVGVALFFTAFLAVFYVPTGVLYLAAFSLPLVAAFIGLMFQRQATRRASVVSLISAGSALGGLVLGYFLYHTAGLAFGYFMAMGAILVAGAAVAIRLIGGRRLGEFGRRTRWEEIEPARSAAQEALLRSRNS